MRKKLMLTMAVVLMASVGLAATSKFEGVNDKATPAGKNNLGKLTVISTNNTTSIDSTSHNFPFNVSWNETVERNTTHANFTGKLIGAVPGDYPPGSYSNDFFVSLSTASVSQTIDYEVATVRNWTVTRHGFKNKLNIGSRGRYGNLTVVEKGNTEENVDIRITGNISQFLSVDSTVSLPVDNPQNIVVSYQVPSDTGFGNYTGTLTVTGGNQSKNISLQTRFVDDTGPVISDLKVQDVQATKPEWATVTVTDNLAVDRVVGRVVTTVTVGNDTVNTTVSSLTFSRDESSDTWRVMPPANNTGVFFLEVEAFDTSGNREIAWERFEVSALDVIRSRGTVRISRHRVGSEVLKEIATLQQETSLSVTLDSFNQPLESGNETWTIGIQNPAGSNTFFSSVGDTVTVRGKGAVKLFVHSDAAEVFNGRLNLSGIKQHISVEDVQFSGAWVNYTVPSDQNFTVFDTTHKCEAVRSDQLNESGWNCEYFVSADVVPPGTSLGENVRTVIPSDVQENFVEEKNRRITELEQTVSDYRTGIYLIVGISVVIVIISIFAGFYSDSFYFVDLSEPRTKREQFEELVGEEQ